MNSLSLGHVDGFSKSEAFEAVHFPSILSGNFFRSSVSIKIVGICNGSSLCFWACRNAESGFRIDLTLKDYGLIHKDRDNDANDRDDDEREISDNSSSGTKKYRGSNSSDGGNTGDGVKIVGGVIGSGDE
ncbi:hypothetical protein Tco_0821619 [Tanacetum coccineum]|uniref:Uncharacterized protein n=1 Tax=Tanacetum coccineum TaxID=301880 RepID=A0ABQ5ACT0_9ASTR